MSDLIERLRALLAETPGNYINVAKVRAILDRRDEEQDQHLDHAKLWVHGQTLCGCGQWMPGMATIALPKETPFINAYSAAVSAYARALETDDRLAINACLEAALVAALAEYGIEVGDWFAEAYGDERKPDTSGSAEIAAIIEDQQLPY